MPSVRSVSLGFWIGSGSRAETEAQAGLSHLLEHLLFKGSSKYESLEIDQIFDAMGAELNAGTGKETTSVYARVIDQHVPEAFDVMADMVFRPSLTDIDSERAVILEEIAMYEDEPQEKVFDVLGAAVFGDHPLGRAIIGYAPVIAQTPATDIASFHAERYAPPTSSFRPRGRSITTRWWRWRPSACRRRRPSAYMCGGMPRRARRPRSCSSARTRSSTTCVSALPDSPATMSAASPCACSTTSSAVRLP